MAELRRHGGPDRALRTLRDLMGAFGLRPEAVRVLEVEIHRVWSGIAPLTVEPDRGGFGALISPQPRPPSRSGTVQAVMSAIRRCPDTGALISGMATARSMPVDARDAMMVVETALEANRWRSRTEMEENDPRRLAHGLSAPEPNVFATLLKGRQGDWRDRYRVRHDDATPRFTVLGDIREMLQRVATDRLRRHGSIRLPMAVWLERHPPDEYTDHPVLVMNVRMDRAFHLPVGDDWRLPLPCDPRRLPAGKADEGNPLNTAENPFVPRGVEIALPPGEKTIGGVAAMLEREIQSALQQDLRHARDLAWKGFSAELDRDALETAVATGSRNGGVIYSWLQSGGDARLAAVRRQACEAYPFLVTTLVLDDKRRSALDTAIGEEVPLEPVLADLSGLPPQAVRALGGVGCAGGEEDSYGTLGFRLEGLVGDIRLGMSLPAASWPARGAVPLEDQWRGLTHLYGLVKNLAWWSSKTPGADDAARRARRMFPAEPPIWKSLGGIARIDRWRQEYDHATDALEAMGNELVLPLLCDLARERGEEDPEAYAMERLWTSPSMAWELLGGDGSFARAVELSRRWHRSERDIAAALAGSDPREWPPLLPRPVELDGLVFASLHTSPQLGTEGAAMDHCVASYVSACLYSRSHIVGVTTPDGERVSTIEFRTGASYPQGIEIVQNKGPRNRDPGEAAREAGLALLGMLRRGEAEWDPNGLEAAAAVRSEESGLDQMIATLNYDPRTPGARDTALRAWNAVLPHDLRGETHAEWAERLGMMDRLRAMVGPPVGDATPGLGMAA